MNTRASTLLLSLLLLVPATLPAQDGGDEEEGSDDQPSLDASLLSGLEFRAIGPALTSGRIGDLEERERVGVRQAAEPGPGPTRCAAGQECKQGQERDRRARHTAPPRGPSRLATHLHHSTGHRPRTVNLSGNRCVEVPATRPWAVQIRRDTPCERSWPLPRRATPGRR